MQPLPTEFNAGQMKIYASEFASQATKKNVHGKFPAKTMVPGLASGISEGRQVFAYQDHGPDKIPLGDLESEIIYKLHPKITQAYLDKRNEFKLNELVTNQLVLINGKVMTICFYQDSTTADRGTIHPSYVQIELPKETLEKLKKEIILSPDLLEYFYQASFPDLDSTPERPGARRIPSDGFIMLDETRTNSIKELMLRIKSYPGDGQILQLKKYFKEIEPLKNKMGPYGTGNKTELQ